MFIVVINRGIILEMRSGELVTTVPFKTNVVEMRVQIINFCATTLCHLHFLQHQMIKIADSKL